MTHKPSITITTGSGGGKTESFLLPLLNDLLKHRPIADEGISAIILYPMNALINDQADRLCQWLSGQSEITSLSFTSETPEDSQAANKQKAPVWDSCRIRTRNQARGLEDACGKRFKGHRAPAPRILVSNYAMLEYMLCRPQDSVFFGKNLRTLVLDEAHLYTGALAADIAVLQRRILMRCGLESSDVVQFSASATIDQHHLKEFIAKIFSKPVDDCIIIQGEPNYPQLPVVSPPEEKITPDNYKTPLA